MFKTIYMRFPAVAALPLAVAATGALANGAHDQGTNGDGHGAPHGAPGEPSQVSRSIEVVMDDTYFEPERLEVQAGETIRFEIRNKGTLVHEFNIGTPEMHADHADEMMAMMEEGVMTPQSLDEQAMEGMHDHANSVLLEPGESDEVVWTFPEETDVTLEFGCNVPGHYASGMVGEFELKH
ncbi:cupredoxin domain-containing protein [Fodinicurvata halophila]|uniref:Cupredoxin domain-containing protein n=2 Tax=Fodinicurvata halophila TaxID=1419723 RepID=A0ABV8UI79_9PROT